MLTRRLTTKVSVLLFAIPLFVMTAGLTGCGKKGGDSYGQQISDKSATPLKGILESPDDFDGKEVKIEGKIVRECMSGCWFDVESEDGWVHVDIKPSGLAIPQEVGKKVVVEGKVSVRDGKPIVIGKGVEIK